MEIREYARVLRRSWLVLVSVSVICALAGLLVANLQPRTYSSTAKSYVSATVAQSLGDLSQGTSFTQQAVKSFADIATTSYVLDGVARDLQLDEPADELRDRISVVAVPEETVLEITVTDRSPTGAAAVANAIAARLATAVESLIPDTNDARSPLRVTQIDPARPSSDPVEPRPLLAALLGGLIGLLAAFVIAVVREILDTRVRSVKDVERMVDRPILGMIPLAPAGKDAVLALRDAADGAQAEAFRTLRTNLQFIEFVERTASVLVTSSVDGEGKSTTAANLGLAVSGLGERVLVVDADLRRPTIAELFGVEGAVGLTDVLIGRASVDEALQSVGDTSLMVLPAGTRPPNPNELLNSRRMTDLMADLSQRFDFIVIDSPPLLPVSDAVILAPHAGGVLVVCGVGRARRADVVGALTALQQVEARVIGVVMTMVPFRGPDAVAYLRETDYSRPARVRTSRHVRGGLLLRRAARRSSEERSA